MIKCTVVNIKKTTNKDYIYIGRGSKWGNPFTMNNYTQEERDRVCNEYEKWFITQKHLMDSLDELKGKKLGCYCHPKRCHGHFLAKLINERV